MRPTFGANSPSTATATESSTFRAAASARSPPPGTTTRAWLARSPAIPNLRLFVGVNYFDLNAPFYAAEYTLAHLNVSPEVRAHNITVSHFEAGQMTYADSKALGKLHTDLARFVNEAISPARK